MELWLNDRGITSLDRDGFKGMNGMTQLFLWGNQLTALPAGIFRDLPNLRWLELGTNRLTSLPDVFHQLSLLEALGLRQNGIGEIQANVFERLGKLLKLELSNNAFSTLPLNVFDWLLVLEELYLYNNTLQCSPMTAESQDRLVYYWGPPPCPQGCMAGSYSCYASAIGCGDLCTQCPPGKFAEQGATVCLNCAAGTYSAVLGAESSGLSREVR